MPEPLPIKRHLFRCFTVACSSRGYRFTFTEILLPLIKRATSLSPTKSTPDSRNSLEMSETRPPFGEEVRVLLFNDVEDFVEFMLLESFVPSQANRLQPEFTIVSRFFNVNVRRHEIVGKVKVEPKTIFTQNGRHSFINL